MRTTTSPILGAARVTVADIACGYCSLSVPAFCFHSCLLVLLLLLLIHLFLLLILALLRLFLRSLLLLFILASDLASSSSFLHLIPLHLVLVLLLPPTTD